MYNDKKDKLLPVMICSNNSQIKAYVNPTRIIILKLLIKEKRTITSVAKELKVHPANLTHHFKLLEKEGLIKLVEKRDTGKNLEKYYRAVAKKYIVNPDLDKDLNKNKLQLAILSNDLTSALNNMQKNSSGKIVALLGSVRLLPDDIDKLEDELLGVIRKYKNLNSENGMVYNINLSAYPGEIDINTDENIII